MSYVDASQHEGETTDDARRRRRHELARGWRFKCECTRCVAEETAGEGEGNAEDLGVEKDESRVEAVVSRVEKNVDNTGSDVE